jgi:hypothetical protein
MTDAELRDAFETLDRAPTDAEIAAVIVATQRRPRRWVGAAVAFAVVAAAVGAVLIFIPTGSDEREVTVSGSSLLQAASAVAAEQPEPPAFTGYRYTDVLSRWRNGPVRREGLRFQETEQRRETWVDRDWKGYEVVHRGRIIEGTRTPADLRALAGRRRPFAYGDAPKAYVDRLPTEPARLRDALIDSMRVDQWRESPDDPVGKETWIEYHLVRRTIMLLESANTTPQLRAGLWAVLATAPGVRPAPEARDPLGRPGTAVAIPGIGATFTVVYDPDTSELRHWSLLGEKYHGERHTILRTAHVRRIGDRE